MKVLIIEDDKSIVDIVSLSLKIRWPDTNLISTHLGEEGIQLTKNEAPDVVILDLGLPDINGFEVLKTVREYSSVPIIILSVLGEEETVVKGLEIGADEYITKPFHQMELLARVKALIRRAGSQDKLPPISMGAIRFWPSMNKLLQDEKEIKLTRTESLILYQLMRNQGQVVPYSKLYDGMWSNESAGAVEALRVHIRRLREKLEAKPSEPKLIQTKVGVGYCLINPETG